MWTFDGLARFRFPHVDRVGQVEVNGARCGAILFWGHMKTLKEKQLSLLQRSASRSPPVSVPTPTAEAILSGAFDGDDVDEVRLLSAIIRIIAARWKPGRPVVAIADRSTRNMWRAWKQAGGTASIALKVAIGMQLDDWPERGRVPPTLRLIMRQSSDRIDRFLDLYEQVRAGAKLRWPSGEEQQSAMLELRTIFADVANAPLVGWWKWNEIRSGIDGMSEEEAVEWMRILKPEIEAARKNITNGLPPRHGMLT